MKKYLIFAGTTEGRKLAQSLCQCAEITVSVTTEYGASLLKELPVHLLLGSMDKEEMIDYLRYHIFHGVIDATHPYAHLATENIHQACAELHIPYFRCRRPDSDLTGCRAFDNSEELIGALSETEGAVLLTTGSKQMEEFTRIPEFSSRLYLRILPDPETISKALKIGYLPNHLLAMQGPFSKEFNAACCRQFHIRILVTKDGGAPASFEEKKQGALEAGAEVYVLKRPSHESGFLPEEICRMLEDQT